MKRIFLITLCLVFYSCKMSLSKGISPKSNSIASTPDSRIILPGDTWLNGYDVKKFILKSGEEFNIGTKDSSFKLAMQSDGNLVLYNGATPLWNSATVGLCLNCKAEMQDDGNLVITNENTMQVVFSTGTNNTSCILHFSKTEPFLRMSEGSESVLWTGGSTIWKGIVPNVFLANSSSSLHEIGSAVASATSWGVDSSSSPGYLTTTSNLLSLPSGIFKASFSLKVDNNSADNYAIGILEVFDKITGKILAFREFHRKEFTLPMVFQDFDLTFPITSSNNLEFRVSYAGYTYLEHEKTVLTQINDSTSNLIFYATSTYNNHQIGNKKSSISWATNASDGAGVLTYGPYTKMIGPGVFNAVFDLQIDNNTSDNSEIVTIDINQASTGKVLATRTITRHEFTQINQKQSFELSFLNNADGTLEFRVMTKGISYLEHFQTQIVPQSKIFYKATDARLSHQVGSAYMTSWQANSTDGPGYITYGPYTQDILIGNLTASFRLAIDNNMANNSIVSSVEVYDVDNSRLIGKRLILRKDFNSSMVAQDFDVDFELTTRTKLEFRVYTTGSSLIRHESTTIYPEKLSLSALWNGTAHFEYMKRDDFIGSIGYDGNTSSQVAIDGIWYAFNRQYLPVANTPVSCRPIIGQTLQEVVRKSTDQGKTWSEPVLIASPTGSGCAVVDGGAFYDSETAIWHYLAQCIGTTGGWNLCHYTRTGSSPMGMFQPNTSNPVVVGGALWSPICSGGGKSCPATTVDEGTPQIIAKKNGYFYVTFHGFDYAGMKLGARGIARTTNFVTWETSGAGLPNDAMLTSQDCNSWDANWGAGGCIGFGAARNLRSNGYEYILGEASDKTLLCTLGQVWVFGLVRSPAIAASGNWENYSKNPYIINLLQNDSPFGCGLQYMNLFRDRGEIYLSFGLWTPDMNFPNYTYKLVKGKGPDQLKVK
ncbi:MAG: hypothetical protein PHY93_17705 [Bacteriovorax sp.]|nr:hypothetical protein [Bacteriovorax sp.]